MYHYKKTDKRIQFESKGRSRVGCDLNHEHGSWWWNRWSWYAIHGGLA